MNKQIVKHELEMFRQHCRVCMKGTPENWKLAEEWLDNYVRQHGDSDELRQMANNMLADMKRQSAESARRLVDAMTRAGWGIIL